jgi:hypothetical protein
MFFNQMALIRFINHFLSVMEEQGHRRPLKKLTAEPHPVRAQFWQNLPMIFLFYPDLNRCPIFA